LVLVVWPVPNKLVDSSGSSSRDGEAIDAREGSNVSSSGAVLSVGPRGELIGSAQIASGRQDGVSISSPMDSRGGLQSMVSGLGVSIWGIHDVQGISSIGGGHRILSRVGSVSL